MSKHTPGPWYADGALAAIYTESHPGRVASIDTINRSMREADAALIAAAPDLLAACKAQHEAIDRLFAMLIETKPGFFPTESGQPWAAGLQGNAAIAKAEGRS